MRNVKHWLNLWQDNRHFFIKKTHMRIGSFTILSIGIFLRFYHLFQVDFMRAPFRLGGLFVAFSEKIIENKFRLPVVVPFYSEGGIPFAYPPLGFYVEALFLRLAPDSLFLVANLLPPVVSALALVAVFLFLRWNFREHEAHVLAGTFAYSFLPLAFSNQIEAAGLAEAFGSLALVLFFYTIVRFRSAPGWKNAVWIGLALGISVLSSPGSAIGAACLAGLFGGVTVLQSNFNLKTCGQMILIAVTGLALSAPFWATVMVNHGRGIFVLPVLGQFAGGEKQSFLDALFKRLMNFSVVQDGSFFFWNLVIFMGLLWLVLHGNFELPLAFLVLFSIPRENVWLTALPAALLFSYGCAQFLSPSFQPVLTAPKRLLRTGLSLLLVFISAWMIIQSFSLSNALAADQQWKISAAQIKLITDARSLIPVDKKVIVISNDAMLEWAPYLLKREVINTKFGLEWQPSELEIVNQLNKKIADASSWDNILLAVAQLTGHKSVYVLSSEKKLLTELSRNSQIQLKLIIETPEVQLGILGSP